MLQFRNIRVEGADSKEVKNRPFRNPMKLSSKTFRKIRPVFVFFAAAALQSAHAQPGAGGPQGIPEEDTLQVLVGTTGTEQGVQVAPTEPAGAGAFQDWWDGKGLFAGKGNPLFDGRAALEDRGLKFSGIYQGAFFGVVASEKGARGFWDEQVALGAELDFGKLSGVEALGGIRAFGNFRYRDSGAQSNPNGNVQASPMFNPSNWTSGTQFRILAFGLQVSTEGWLPVEDMVVLRGGWLQPQREFIDQPLSKLFLNNAVNSSKGVGGNIPFSSSFTSWGGTLNFKPREEFYVKNGLFMSFPKGSETSNHGLAFGGYSADPSLNGLFYMGEGGWTPEFGKAELAGKYAFGGYFYGTPQGQTETWNGTEANGRYGFYFQADQMLFRESDPQAPAGTPGGKGFQQPVSAGKPKLSKQGLHTFNLLTFAPGNAVQNVYPFYFQTGLTYTGALPGRGEDQAMVSLAYGSYERGVGRTPRTYTAVVEAGYRFQVNGWSYVQPFFQYFSNPNGTGELANAAVLGFMAGVAF